MPAFGESIVGDLALQREFFTAIQRLRDPGTLPEQQKQAFLTTAMAWPLILNPDQREAFKKNIRCLDREIMDRKITTWVAEGGTMLFLSLYPGRDAARWVLERRGSNGDASATLVWSVGDRTQLASVTYTGPEGHLEIDHRGIITGVTQDLASYRRGYADVPRLISSMACLSAVPDIPGALARRD